MDYDGIDINACCNDRLFAWFIAFDSTDFQSRFIKYDSQNTIDEIERTFFR